MNDKKRTPVTLLSGALGAGKTTFIQKVLKENPNLQFAVVENEFSDLSMDSEILAETGDIIVEMNAGCLCCTIKGDMVESLKKLLRDNQGIDHVIIESTGLANPASIAEAFIGEDSLADIFELKQCITIVDTVNFHTSLQAQSEAAAQIAFADIILLSKSDLPNDNAQEVQTSILKFNNIAQVLTTKETKTTELLSQNFYDQKELKPIMTHHHESINSHTFELKGQFDPMNFQLFLNFLYRQNQGNILRAKGIIAFTTQPKKVYFHAVFQSFDFNLSNKDHEDGHTNQLVFIGKDLNYDIILKGLQNCLAKK